MTVQHVVVGIDEGQLADSAILAALHVSRMLHAPLEVVHAIHTGIEKPWFADEATLSRLRAEILEEAKKSRSRHLWKLLREHAVTHQEIDAMLHVAIDHPATLLKARAAEREGAMVVLGGHRHRGVLDFGGTIREMTTHFTAPVWIQGAHAWNEIRSILVAIDLSPGSTPIWSMARGLAARTGAKVRVLHCFEPPVHPYEAESELGSLVDDMRDRDRREFERFLSEIDDADGTKREVEIDTRFEEGDPASRILELQSEHDLLVIGTHGHSGIRRILLGSHAQRILREAERPVLVMPQPTIPGA